MTRSPSERLTSWTSSEARQRLQQFGFNDLVKSRKTSRIVEFLLVLVEPLIAILLVASAVSAIVGDVVNAIIILVMVLLGVLLNFIQTSTQRKGNFLLAGLLNRWPRRQRSYSLFERSETLLRAVRAEA